MNTSHPCRVPFHCQGIHSINPIPKIQIMSMTTIVCVIICCEKIYNYTQSMSTTDNHIFLWLNHFDKSICENTHNTVL